MQAGVSCGIETDLTSTHVNGVAVVRIKRSTRERAIAALRRVLDSGKLRPVEAGSLRGQLGYVLGLGRVGKAALKPLVDKEHQANGLDEIDDVLRAAATALLGLLQSEFARRRVIPRWPDAGRAHYIFGCAL